MIAVDESSGSRVQVIDLGVAEDMLPARQKLERTIERLESCDRYQGDGGCLELCRFLVDPGGSQPQGGIGDKPQQGVERVRGRQVTCGELEKRLRQRYRPPLPPAARCESRTASR